MKTLVPPYTFPQVTIEPVGSLVTCYPPTIAKDIDWLCLCETKDVETKFWVKLFENGFDLDSEHVYKDGQFTSLRHGADNYITTTDPSFFTRFLMARDLCKGLNLLEKDQRIMVHKALIKGEFPEFEDDEAVVTSSGEVVF